MLWKNVDKNTSKVRHISNSKLQSIYTVVKIKNKKISCTFLQYSLCTYSWKYWV